MMWIFDSIAAESISVLKANAQIETMHEIVSLNVLCKLTTKHCGLFYSKDPPPKQLS